MLEPEFRRLIHRVDRSSSVWASICSWVSRLLREFDRFFLGLDDVRASYDLITSSQSGKNNRRRRRARSSGSVVVVVGTVDFSRPSWQSETEVGDSRTERDNAMNIEITGETEKLIRAAIATGRYASAEEFIAEMVRRSQKEVSPRPVPWMSQRLDVNALATAQGVGPIENFRDLEADFVPPGESMEAFVQAIRTLRDADEPRTP